MADAVSQSHDPQRTPERLLRGIEGVASARKRGPAPVHLWNPPFCGDIDMRIARDGTWFYNGSPIGRAPLVQLFASILRRDEERYVLVTPVERVGIVVDDAPFLGVELIVGDANGAPSLTFRTNVEDFVTIDADHPLRFENGASEGLKPYVLVRGGLWALVKRALFYDLVALGQTQNWKGEDWFGVFSCGIFFPMIRAAALEGL
jgi:uncharacterized protein